MKPMEKQTVNVRFPKQLLDRIDAFKEEKGFGTRTQAIFYLIQAQLMKKVRSSRAIMHGSFFTFPAA